MPDRRAFFGRLGGLALIPVLAQTPAVPEQAPAPGTSGALRDPVSAGRSRERVSPKDNDGSVMAVEKRLRCTCGCTLDIYTCRTTDFTCTYSPELHKEVVVLHDGGMNGDQIVAAFVEKYGEKVLMAPKPEGFNVTGYVVPGALILLVAGAMFAFLRRRARLQLAGTAPGQASAGAPAGPPAASADDLARLRQALRESDQ